MVGKTHKKVLDVKCTEGAAPIKSQVHYSNFYCRQHLPAFLNTYGSEYSCCWNRHVFSLNKVKNSNRPATNKNSVSPKAFVVFNTWRYYWNKGLLWGRWNQCSSLFPRYYAASPIRSPRPLPIYLHMQKARRGLQTQRRCCRQLRVAHLR